jgi:hypothetical protein
MKFNARVDSSPDAKRAFVAWLVDGTTSSLRKVAGDVEALKAAVFLYLNRAYEAGLHAEEITDLLGIGPQNVMSRASLSKTD